MAKIHADQGKGAGDHHDDDLELFVLFLVLVFSFFVKDGDIDRSEDDFEIGSGLSW